MITGAPPPAGVTVTVMTWSPAGIRFFDPDKPAHWNGAVGSVRTTFRRVPTSPAPRRSTLPPPWRWTPNEKKRRLRASTPPLWVARHEVSPPGASWHAIPTAGLLARNRLFFLFSVQRQGGGKVTGVTQVTWALDGVVVRTDPTAPFQWAGVSGSKKRMPAGDHVITVTVTPAGGGVPVVISFPVIRDGLPAGVDLLRDRGDDRRRQAAAGLAALRDLVVRIADGPVAGRRRDPFRRRLGPDRRRPLRGRVAGMLTLWPGASRQLTTRTLRVSRSGSTLLSRGTLKVALHLGARRFLTVQGLPAQDPRGHRPPDRIGWPRPAAGRAASARTAAATGWPRTIAGTSRTLAVDGGVTSGLCRFAHALSRHSPASSRVTRWRPRG